MACATIPKTGYDEDIAYKGVMYSGAAYCSYNDLDKWDCGYPCKQMPQVTPIIRQSVVNAHDLFGYVAFNPDDLELIVAFRGTNGLDFKNWYMNSKTDKIPYENVKGALVHSGWYNGW